MKKSENGGVDVVEVVRCQVFCLYEKFIDEMTPKQNDKISKVLELLVD